MYDIVTIGSATRDNFLKTDYSLIKWPKTSSGKAIALPLGEKISVNEVYLTIGGNAANASVTFGRQKFRTGCFGKVGDDLSGKELITRLKKEGVNPFFAVSKEKPTAYSVLLLSGDHGERTILGYHGAADTLAPKDIPWDKLKSKWWYLSLGGESDRFLEPLLAFARKNKIKVAFNPSGHHIKHYRNRILSALKYLSFLVVNETEAANLTGISFKKENEVFKRLDKLTPGIVAVTSGPKGVTVSDGRKIYKAGIIKEQKQLDRTGAGDAFGSGFTAGLIRHPGDIPYAIRLATANAASVVEHIGATEGILAKKDFETSSRWKNLKIWTTTLKK